jgi:peptide-methionine (R)-S-oxide reductase
MRRRDIVLGGAGLVGLAALFELVPALSEVQAGAEAFEVAKSEAEWKQALTPDQFRVLRHAATERPFSSALNDEHRRGTFHCAGCDLPLFASDTKFDSGTGWPSFYAPLDDAVRVKSDFSMLIRRDEVHCRRCGGHLGHVFNDGPQPTGKRYCMNGVSLRFVPTGGASS